MGSCSCHPEIETSFMCMKHNKYLCEECLKCQDPDIYCKFRTSCPIHFMEKRGGRQMMQEEEGATERTV